MRCNRVNAKVLISVKKSDLGSHSTKVLLLALRLVSVYYCFSSLHQLFGDSGNADGSSRKYPPDRGQLRRPVGTHHSSKDKHLWGNPGFEAQIQAHRVLVGIHRWVRFRVGVRVLGTRSTLLHFLVDFHGSYTGFASFVQNSMRMT